MLTISLSSVIEQAAFGVPDLHRLSGNVADIDALLEPARLAALEKAHHGVFAFFAFDPAGDQAVRAYLESGTLAADSGPHVLALFTSARSSSAPVPMSSALLDIVQVESAESPSRRMLAELFDGKQVPPLPGLAVWRDLTQKSEVLYFDLTAQTEDEVRHTVRSVLALAETAYRLGSGKHPFSDELAVAAQKDHFAFRRTGRVSMRQWLIQAFQWTQRNGGDIVAALALVPL
jgi:hypothetical protein